MPNRGPYRVRRGGKQFPGMAVRAEIEPDKAKVLVGNRLRDWLSDVSEYVAGLAREHAPVDTQHGRNWINASVADSGQVAAVGIIKGGRASGSVPEYMGYIELGITPHWVSLKHYGVRAWAKRVLGWKAKQNERGYYPSMFVWGKVRPKGYRGPKRFKKAGRVGIHWLSQPFKQSRQFAMQRLKALGAH